jgi:flagellar biosynthesis protein FlhG
MRPEAHPADQAHGLRRAFRRTGLSVLPVCVPGRDDASQGWIVHAAAALAERGRRVLVLDADRGHVAPALGLKARLELRHLLTGECAFGDAILAAGTNLSVLPATHGLEMFLKSGEVPATLFGAFLVLPEPPDVLLANGPVALVAPLVEPGEEVLFVASPARESVTGVYAAIKRMEQDFPGRIARVAVIGAIDAQAGETLVARIAEATARFLNRRPVFAGAVRGDPALASSARAAASVIAAAPESSAADDFRRIADSFDQWRTAVYDVPLEG